MEDHTDRGLLDRFITHRDDSAFRQLVERHMPLAYGVARRTTGREDLARDATQEAFILLARNAATVPRHADIGAWVYRLARHAAVDLVRSEDRRRKREGLASFDPSSTNRAVDESAVDAAWSRVAPLVDGLIDKLPEGDRDILIARYFRNESHASIAFRLGMSELAIRKRSSRALAKLRGLLLRRGVATSSSILAALLPANAAVIPAPPALMTAVTGAVRGVTPLPPGLTSARMAMNGTQKSSIAAAACILLASAGYAFRPLSPPAVPAPPPPAVASLPAKASTAADRNRTLRRLPATAEERLQRLREIGEMPDQIERSRELLSFVDLLPANLYEETYRQVRSLMFSRPDGNLVLMAWAKIEPQGMADWLVAPNSMMTAQMPYTTRDFLQIWGESDPEAALAWIDSQTHEAIPRPPRPLFSRRDSERYRDAISALVTGWALHDPEAAIACLARSLPGRESRGFALMQVGRALSSHPEALAKILAALSPVSEQPRLDGDLEWLAGLGETEALAERERTGRLGELDEPRAATRSAFLETQLQGFIPEAPERGVESLLSEPNAASSGLVWSYYSRWLARDWQEAAASLLKLPAGPVRDAALDTVTMNISVEKAPEILELLRRNPDAYPFELTERAICVSDHTRTFEGVGDLLLIRDAELRDENFLVLFGPLIVSDPHRAVSWMASHEVPAPLRKKLEPYLPKPLPR